MEIIDKLEPTARSYYGGAIGIMVLMEVAIMPS
jgi:anthranilate/para-aminobenzoate synthase component I